MIDINPLQIFLIVSLVLIFPIGLWNQKRMAKAKQNSMQSYSYNPNMGGDNLNENEKKAQEYIIQYKSTYSKESVKTGLLNMGLSDSESESYLSKYFN
ncbi:MAG: hypothetical protein PF569_07670 [Candidatus Woesearchaeota archaeon]|jgi:hypothetical protein|nr:hypothetical protein [Candidatus Woesearchaeota archaeon]